MQSWIWSCSWILKGMQLDIIALQWITFALRPDCYFHSVWCSQSIRIRRKSPKSFGDSNKMWWYKGGFSVHLPSYRFTPRFHVHLAPCSADTSPALPFPNLVTCFSKVSNVEANSQNKYTFQWYDYEIQEGSWFLNKQKLYIILENSVLPIGVIITYKYCL